MKALVIIFMLLFSYPVLANYGVGYAIGYNTGYSSHHCSCGSDEYEIYRLKQEIEKLKEELEACSKKETNRNDLGRN